MKNFDLILYMYLIWTFSHTNLASVMFLLTGVVHVAHVVRQKLETGVERDLQVPDLAVLLVDDARAAERNPTVVR